jgi:exosortase
VCSSDLIQKLIHTWSTQEDYQHGFFVPVFAIVLLWLRREMFVPFAGKGSLWGLAVLLLWAVIRWAAVYFNYESLPELSMIPFFAGVALFVGGWQAFRWAWPSLFFLCFMLPLPGGVQGWASQQLQGVAARISGFVIQTLGFSAVVTGHTINLSGWKDPLDVARACSGLRMLMLFFALCIGAAFVVKKPLWEKLLMVASAAPIAVASNVVRIVLTAVLCDFSRRWPSLIDQEKAMEVIHNWVGYLVMMPFGLLLLWLEMFLLGKLLIEPLPDRPLAAGRLAAEKAVEGGVHRGERIARNKT